MYAKTTIIGRLGQDCETRAMPSGGEVANFSVATDIKWRDKQSGEEKKLTTWYRCNLFGPIVPKISHYLTKGQLVFCEGTMRERKWTDREGNDRYSWELKVDQVKLLGGRNDQQGGQLPGGAPAQPSASGQLPPANDDFDDDIPF